MWTQRLSPLYYYRVCRPLQDDARGGAHLHASSSEPTGGGGGPGDGNERDPQYYANVGTAIRALRDDLPRTFERAPCFDIFRPDIVFRDPKNAISGLPRYKVWGGGGGEVEGGGSFWRSLLGGGGAIIGSEDRLARYK